MYIIIFQYDGYDEFINNRVYAVMEQNNSIKVFEKKADAKKFLIEFEEEENINARVVSI